ncbi:hypothetical protein CR513_12980, partial [Mucuna pruriens]
MKFQQNMSTTIQDLKMQIGQLANIVIHLQSAGSSNLPLQTIPNPRGNASIVTLRSSRELPQITLQQEPRPIDTDFEPNVDSQVEINIPLLDAIKQIPKYAKFLKELCVHNKK